MAVAAAITCTGALIAFGLFSLNARIRSFSVLSICFVTRCNQCALSHNKNSATVCNHAPQQDFCRSSVRAIVFDALQDKFSTLITEVLSPASTVR